MVATGNDRNGNGVSKRKVECKGGPMHGVGLYLTDMGGTSTLPFELHGMYGRYRNGDWEHVYRAPLSIVK